MRLDGRSLVDWRYCAKLGMRYRVSLKWPKPQFHHLVGYRAICHHARDSPVRARVPTTSPRVSRAEQQRGAKTKSTVKLKDLPQGILKLDAYEDGADDVPRYPTVVQGHRNNMQKFKNCVILTRVGGFYEV